MRRSLRNLLPLAFFALTLAALLSLVAASAVHVNQVAVTPTITVSTAASMLINSTMTVTTTSTQYTNTTRVYTSTLVQGTMTTTLFSATTASIFSTTTDYLGIPATSTTTTTLVSPTQILGNALGELIVGLAGVAAIVVITILVIPKTLVTPKKGLICEKCGCLNSPYVSSFCTGCGEALGRTKPTRRAGKSFTQAPD
jgi:hypothetical protein